MMNNYNQNQPKDNKNIKRAAFTTVVTAMAVLALAACGNTNAGSSKNSAGTQPKVSQQEKRSATTEGSNINGDIINNPTDLAQFEDVVEEAGFTIIPGLDKDIKQVSGAVKEDDGSFYTNVEVGKYTGAVGYASTNGWGIISSDGKISAGGGNLKTSTASGFEDLEESSSTN